MFRSGGPTEVTESGLALPLYDALTNTPTSTTDVYAFFYRSVKLATVTIMYEDDTKSTILSVTKAVP